MVHAGGKVEGLELPKRVFPCASPAEVRSTLPEGKDVLAFQCRNPIHKAHYELFIRALEAPNVGPDAVCLVHPTCGPTQVTLPPNHPLVCVVCMRLAGYDGSMMALESVLTSHTLAHYLSRHKCMLTQHS